MFGKNIYSEKLNNNIGLNTYKLDTSDWSDGMYFVIIDFEGKKIQQKLIIK